MFQYMRGHSWLMLLTIFIGMKCLVGSIAAPAWPEIAYRDITAAYNQLRDNHPGYCDSENLQWKDMLESEYDNVSSKIKKA